MDDINLIGNEKGTTVVEATLIIMLLLLFIFGIIEFGLLIFNKQVLTDASREGARAGIVIGLDRSGGDAAEYVTVSINTASNYCVKHLVTFGSGVPFIDPPYYNDLDGNGLPNRGENLTLRLKYDYNFLLLSAFKIIEYPINLEAVTVMRFE